MTPSDGIWKSTGALLRGSFRLVRQGGYRLAGLILITQLIILGAALPVISWLFREALRAGGMHGLDMGNLQFGDGIPLTLTLIVVIILFAFWLIALQFTAIVVLLRWSGEALTLRQFIRALSRVARKLLRPSSLQLLGYLFLLLPLTGFGFTSAIVRGIAIPSFISGELFKTATGTVILLGFLLILALVNIRFAATVPVFVLTNATGGWAMRVSWRLTRGLRGSVPLVLAGAVTLTLSAVASVVLLLAAVIPTAISDVVAPDAAPVVAALSLGIAQVIGFFLSGGLTALVAGILITHVLSRELPKGVELNRIADLEGGRSARVSRATPARKARGPLAVSIAAAVLALAFGLSSIGTLQQLSEQPETLVLAHRGFSDGGVENTLGGLEAAARAGADLVEMDVMQTADGEFVAMHDANLSRLADRPEAIKDLTLAELTQITVHDLQGHEDTIPSFSDYVRRAEELEMPLLIEIKLGGADTEDHVDRLVAELEDLGALQNNIYHSLDPASVSSLKELRPDLTVGYTMAFAGGGIPDTPADFIVVEEWTATEAMQRAATHAGLGFMVWTVNDTPGVREHLRRSSDGIITDHPDEALASRDEMQAETGLASVLIDALTRFVKVP